MRRRLVMLTAFAIAVIARPVGAGLLTISAAGTTGPGGTITFSEIGQIDPSSANVNIDFTAAGTIPITFTVSDSSPVSIYGNDVNDTLATWIGFTASVVSGSATFQDPNDLFNPYSTYSDTPGWTVSLLNQGTTAVFAGGQIAQGVSLDTFLGLVVSDASTPVTVVLSASVPEPPALALALVAGLIVGTVFLRRRSWAHHGVVAATAASVLAGPAQAAGPQVVPAYQNALSIQSVGQVGGRPTQITFGPSGLLYAMTADEGVFSYVYDSATGALSSPVNAVPNVQGIGIGFHGNNMYISLFDGTIHKLDDANNNGIWGETGELDAAIVTGIPWAITRSTRSRSWATRSMSASAGARSTGTWGPGPAGRSTIRAAGDSFPAGSAGPGGIRPTTAPSPGSRI